MPSLDQIPVGTRGVILSITGEDVIAQRLMEMGVIDGEPFHLLRTAPLGDPLDVEIHGYRLSLRKTEASRVQVQIS
ncbi:MAG: FeoA family protein [Gemmataceae bacterium]